MEERFSEHLLQARDLYQKYVGLDAAQVFATLEGFGLSSPMALARRSSRVASTKELEIANEQHDDQRPYGSRTR